MNREQIGIVESHDDVLRSQQLRVHEDVNRKFPRTGVDLSRYRSLKLSPRPSSHTSANSARDEYTLYLFHAYSEADAQGFMARRPVDDNLRYLSATGEDRFALVYGSYRSNNEARDAVDRLPPDIARLQPVVKLVADLVGDD